MGHTGIMECRDYEHRNLDGHNGIVGKHPAKPKASGSTSLVLLHFQCGVHDN